MLSRITTGPAPRANPGTDAYEQWKIRAAELTAAVIERGMARAAASEIATSYAAMQEMWSDADAQARGASSAVLWDTYENGRRRQMELRLGAQRGDEQVILVNSGMGAIASASIALRGATTYEVRSLNTHYFETTELFETLRSVGVTVEAYDATKPEPSVLLVEAISSGIEWSVTPWADIAAAARAGSYVILDASSVSRLAVPSLERDIAGRIVVVESVGKFITTNCSAGVIYADENAGAAIRLTARRLGILLQGKALAFIDHSEVDSVSERLKEHERGKTAFLDEMAACGRIRLTLSVPRLADDWRSEVHGCIVYASLLGGSDGDQDARHEALVDGWVRCAAAAGLDIHIRAGFGWIGTSARAYRAGSMNSSSGRSHVRISIGREPEGVLRRMAYWLAETAERV